MKGAAVEAGTKNELARHGRNGPAAAELIFVPFLEECKAPTLHGPDYRQVRLSGEPPPILEVEDRSRAPAVSVLLLYAYTKPYGIKSVIKDSNFVYQRCAGTVRPRAKLTLYFVHTSPG